MWGAENEEPEMSFRHGYQQGAIEVFCAIERFLDPATREVLRAWIEKDVFMWRGKGNARTSPELAVKRDSRAKVCGQAARRLRPKVRRWRWTMREDDGQPLRLLADLTGPACGCYLSLQFTGTVWRMAEAASAVSATGSAHCGSIR
jgi:hypothetical protein